MKALSCPFCRTPMARDEDENRKRMMKRIKKNDPAAIRQMGAKYYDEGDYDSAVEYYTKAAELGDSEAHFKLGVLYHKMEGVEKDENEKKIVYHFEKAAVGGHTDARYNLAMIEERNNGNIERAVKHFIIAANLGCDDSMKALWGAYADRKITKEDLEAALRSHQAAVDATKSQQRDTEEKTRQKAGG